MLDVYWGRILESWQMAFAGKWLLFLAVGLTLETALRAERGHTWRDYAFNIRHAFFYLAAIFGLSPVLNAGCAWLIGLAGPGWFSLAILPTTGLHWQIAAGFITLLVIDFFYYWWHRLQHTVPWLWEQHKVHHSDTALNVSTSARHHWTEFLFQGLFITVPVSVFFALPSVTVWAVTLGIAGWSWFIHMNIRLHLGPLGRVISGPQLHRIHHSCLPEHTDRNFAAYTPIWDILFGTYFAPRPNEYPPTGLHGGERIRTVRLALIYPFVKWWRRIRVTPARPSPAAVTSVASGTSREPAKG